MRRWLWAAAVLLSVAQAAAQGKPADKPAGKDKKDEKKGAGLMEEGASDPSATETLDEGPFVPTGKTGKLKEDTTSVEEKKEIEKLRQRKPLLIFGEALIGIGKGIVTGPADQDLTGKATAYTFMLGGSYDFSQDFTAGLRAPWTTASVEVKVGAGTDTKKQATQAFGAPELFAEYRAEAGPVLRVPLHFSVGIPITQGDPDPTSVADDSNAKKAQSAVQAIADAANGWKDGELYQPGRLPIALRGGIDYERRRYHLAAWEKIILLPKVRGDVSNPDNFFTNGAASVGTVKMNSFAIRSVTALGALYEVVEDKAFLALDLWGAWNLIPTTEFASNSDAASRGRFQLVFEPKLGGTFGPVTPSVGFVLPAGGPFDNEMHGIRVHVDAAF